MRSCPGCQFLIPLDEAECHFCGADVEAVLAARQEALAAREAEIVEAAAAASGERPGPAVIVSAVVGVLVVAVLGFVLFAGGSDGGSVASADQARKIAVRPPVASGATTSTVVTLGGHATPSAEGYTVHGVPDARANLELPSGAKVSKLYGGSLIQIEAGSGVGIAVQSVDDLPLGGGSDDLLEYMSEQTTLEVCEGTLHISDIHAVPHSGGPAVEFTYDLDGEYHGRATIVLVNTTVVLVEMVGMGHATFSPEQTAIYAHAAGSITPVL